MEFLVALFTIILVAMCYKYRKAISRWLNDPRSETAYYDINVLKKYGVENAAERVKEKRHLEDIEIQQFQKEE